MHAKEQTSSEEVDTNSAGSAFQGLTECTENLDPPNDVIVCASGFEAHWTNVGDFAVV